jgi:hypothetical protein
LRVAPPVRRQYDVMPDGSGFLGFVAAAAPHEIYIVQNWFDELNRLVPSQ